MDNANGTLDKTFSPTTNMNTIRLVLAMAKSAFLNGDLEEEFYMYQL